MPFPTPEKQKALDKYVADYKSGKLTEKQRVKWWNEGGEPYDKHFVGWIYFKATPIKGYQHINRFDTLNFFYKINKLMNCGFISEYDSIVIEFRSDEFFDIWRKIADICIQKRLDMNQGIFGDGEIEYLKSLPDWVYSSQDEYTDLYYKSPYFKKEIKTIDDLLWINWVTKNI